MQRCQSGLNRVQSLLADSGYVGQPFAQGGEIPGAHVTVHIAKRSELQLSGDAQTLDRRVQLRLAGKTSATQY